MENNQEIEKKCIATLLMLHLCYFLINLRLFSEEIQAIFTE
jgi:hypothetical protein